MTDTEPTPREPGPWQITNRHEAEWAARLASEATARLDDLKAYVAAETAAIVDSVRPEATKAQATLDRMVAYLHDWHARNVNEQLGRDPDDARTPTAEEWAKVAKSATLTRAKIGARRNPGTFRIVDDDALVEFLRSAAPELVITVTTTKPDRDALVKRVTVKDTGDDTPPVVLLDGEVVPGIDPPDPEVKITVTPLAPPTTTPTGVTLTAPAGFPTIPDPTEAPTP